MPRTTSTTPSTPRAGPSCTSRFTTDCSGKYGWDAIWADNTEPQAYPDSVDQCQRLQGVTQRSARERIFINAYPLQHSKALYEGWRKVGPSTKRVYILTRSAWAGIQRYSAAEWSGDIQADLGTYREADSRGL